MAYVKNPWYDLPSTSTPIDATNLNHIEEGIENNDKRLNGTVPMGNIVVGSIRTKNIFNEVWAYGSINTDGSINTYNSSTSITNSNLIAVKPNTNYVISFSGGNYVIDRIAYFDNSGTFISRSDSLNTKTFTTNANTYYIRFNVWSSGITPSLIGNTQLEEGDTATNYTPYQELDFPNTTPIELTFTTQNIASGTISAWKWGKLVLVSIHDLKLTSAGAGTWSIIVALGLPKRVANSSDTFSYFSLFAKNNKIALATITNSGQVGISCRDTSAMTTSEEFNGSFVYICQ